MSIAFACRYYWIWATQTSPNRALTFELGLGQTFNTVLLFATFAQSSYFLHIYSSVMLRHIRGFTWKAETMKNISNIRNGFRVPSEMENFGSNNGQYSSSTPHIWILTTLIIATWAKIFWMLTKGCLSIMIRWAILFSRFTQTQTHDEWMNVWWTMFLFWFWFLLAINNKWDCWFLAIALTLWSFISNHGCVFCQWICGQMTFSHRFIMAW